MTEETGANLDALRRNLKRMVEEEDDRPKGRGSEKRRHDRHLYMIEATVRYIKRFEQVGNAEDEFVVITKDLSRSGVSFIHQDQMFAGEIVNVELTVGGTPKRFIVKVIRCRRAGLKVFDIAGEFITPEEAEQAGASVKAAGSSPEA